MLTLLLIYSLSIVYLSSGLLPYLLFIFFIFLYYLFNINHFFVSSLRVNCDFLINDEVSIFMRILLFFIMFLAYLLSAQFKSFKSLGVVLLVLTYICYQVFNTTHLFSLYFFYEASLIPIFYIIIK